MKHIARCSAMVYLLILGAGSLLAQGSQDQVKPMAPTKGFRAEFLRVYDDLEKKFVSLAEAFPQEQYPWRPMEGVRSVGEVLGHVAGGNYGYGMWLGVQPPSDIDRRTLEQIGDKSKLVEVLKKSFDHYRQAVWRIPDEDLEKTIKMMNREGTIREAILIVAAHQPEHLGQLIAYARMNRVVPPWAAERQAQQQSPAKK